MNTSTKYDEYARASVDSPQVGLMVRQACRRYLSDLERSDLEFRGAEVARCLSFVGKLKHYTGAHGGKPFVLEPWQ